MGSHVKVSTSWECHFGVTPMVQAVVNAINYTSTVRQRGPLGKPGPLKRSTLLDAEVCPSRRRSSVYEFAVLSLIALRDIRMEQREVS